MKSRKDVSSPSKKLLIQQERPLDPYDKLKYQISDKLFRGERLSGILNNLESLECSVVPETPIESCSSWSTDASRQDEAVASTVIRSDGFCKETCKRKELYYTIKAKVERAIQEHKVFLIRGDLPKLEEALEKRGWVQKYESVKMRMLPYQSTSVLESQSFGSIDQNDRTLNEKALIFSFLQYTPPDFIWDCRNDFVQWDTSLGNNVLLNRFERSSVYTSKLGMAYILQNSHWLHGDNVSTIKYPRSYNPSREAKVFLGEFRRTAAIGLLKWFVSRIQNDQEILDSREESISISQVEFAIEQCEEFLAEEKYGNIDGVDNSVISEEKNEEWNLFLEDYSKVVHKGNRIANSGDDIYMRLEKSYLSANVILKKLKEIDPEYELSGMRNIWILKPSDLCCGTGISISHSVKDIFRRVKAKPKDYFIVQKYIESPLLVHGTKFDIRLWYLVTCTFPLIIWIFEEPLLRFSSKTFCFATYHEAIHLCNTAIQQKYDYEKRRKRMRGNLGDETTDSIRDQEWNCARLNEYLKTQGYEGEPFYDLIYPKMSEAIVLLMLAAQDYLDRRARSFELYGADFMVLEDLTVWLIEINTNPRMNPPSSKITQRLYSSVLESLIKVILDRPINPDADTGGFKLAFKQNIPEFYPNCGPDLFALDKSKLLYEKLRKKNDENDKRF
ncbi:tubulin glycylase 3A-like isoform X2 [Chelonus insularis]|uniref:tubulin glycylase 3A-like isoform X2 n=1 Tax=Chelonus insularis TaxID=460826 RepID=UPI001589F5C4|nr:tubulin glycylase 3A-like isoform X2 [Chelonus insularis]